MALANPDDPASLTGSYPLGDVGSELRVTTVSVNVHDVDGPDPVVARWTFIMSRDAVVNLRVPFDTSAAVATISSGEDRPRFELSDQERQAFRNIVGKE